MSVEDTEDKQLSVVIVSYENLAVLRGCLDSISKFNDIGDALEVIVVEQSRSDEIYNALVDDYPWVVALRNENKGFGAGNNAGARAAHGGLLLFLNPDTVLVEPVFSFALSVSVDDSCLGMFGVRLVDAKGGRNRSFHFRKPYGLARALAWRFFDRLDVFLPKSMYIAGADMFVPADAFRKTGGFDEGMFMYFEETYLCERLNGLGYTVGYFPSKKIVHLEGRSSGGISVLSKQLDSLERLCSSTGKDYVSTLVLMRRDRRFKRLFPGCRSAYTNEMVQIDARLAVERGR